MEFTVGHVVPHFPALSEGGVLNELLFLERIGVAQVIYADEPGAAAELVPEAEPLMRRVLYLGGAGRGLCRRWLHDLGVILRAGVAGPRGVRGAVLVRAGRPNEGRRLARLAAALSVTGACILHVHFAHIALSCWPAARAAGRPLIVSCRGRDVMLLEQRSRRARTHLFANVALFLVRSEAMAADMHALGAPPERVRVHHSGVDLDRLTFSPLSSDMTAEPRVLMVGRLVEKKGFDLALRALARSQLPLRIRVAGSGPEEDRLKVLARQLGLWQRVDWLGAVPRERVIQEMRAATLLLQPSRRARDGDREGIPVSLMEAMALGLPVVATRHAGIPELVEDGVSGVLVDEGDEAALARAIEALLREPSRRAALAVAARAKVEKAFDARKQAETLAACYRSVLGLPPT